MEITLIFLRVILIFVRLLVAARCTIYAKQMFLFCPLIYCCFSLRIYIIYVYWAGKDGKMIILIISSFI